MTQSLFNNILATIGAITGLSGLCISIFLLHKERIRLDVYHPSNTDDIALVGFNRTLNGYVSGVPEYTYSPYAIKLWLRITNKSKSPTTILEMSLLVPNCKESILYSQTPNDYIIATNYTIDKNNKIDIKSNYHFPHPSKPPILLEPYTATEGDFFFLNLNKIDTKPFKAVIKIKTPQRISKHKIMINPIHPKKLND